MTKAIFNHRHSLLICLAVLLCTIVVAQSNNEDSLLISFEKLKWEGLRTGKMNPSASEWFAKDMRSIGYMTDGSVYHTIYDEQKKVFAKPNDSTVKVKFPPATFILSNFKIIMASSDVKILTYQSDGPINLYATTVWSKRDGKWQSIFYQATKYK